MRAGFNYKLEVSDDGGVSFFEDPGGARSLSANNTRIAVHTPPSSSEIVHRSILKPYSNRLPHILSKSVTSNPIQVVNRAQPELVSPGKAYIARIAARNGNVGG